MADAFDMSKLLGDRSVPRTASGLYVVLRDTSVPIPPRPAWTSSELGLAFPAQAEPSFLGQIVVFPSQQDLGFSEISDDEIRELLAPIPLALAVVWSARRTLRVWNAGFSFADQMELVNFIFADNPPLQDKFKSFLANPDNEEIRAAFSDQLFHILTRFALESCSATAPIEWSDDYEARMRRALIAVTRVVEREAAQLTDGATVPKDWLRYFTQAGAYHSKEQQLLAYQRAWRVFVELPETDEAKAHSNYIDFEELANNANGATLREQFAVGFGVARNAEVFDPSEPTNEAIATNLEHYLSTTRLAQRHAVFTAFLTGDQSFYIEGFARSRDSDSRMATDIVPFQQHPLFRLPDGALALLSPRGMESWLAEGPYYRLLNAAAAVGKRDDFTTFVGWLYERYVLELFQSASPEAPVGGGRVHGELPYGGDMTSDVAMDFGHDLILVEVISSMLPLGVRAEANEQVLEQFMDRAVLRKITQLDRVINDLQTGTAQIPDVDFNGVRHVWPVLLTIGDVTEGEPLFEYIKENSPDTLNQNGVQPLTLLGIDDGEVLAGLIASGENPVDLLSSKIRDGYGQLGLDRWYHDRRDGDPPRLPALEERWQNLSNELLEILKLDEAD